MSRPDIDALQALLAKATPGPWYGVGAWVETYDDQIPDICTCDPAAMGQEHLQKDFDKRGLKPRANAHLIASAVNALPELIARVRELERERDEAAIAMRERCARACDRRAGSRDGLVLSGPRTAADCAAAIRALEV